MVVPQYLHPNFTLIDAVYPAKTRSLKSGFVTHSCGVVHNAASCKHNAYRGTLAMHKYHLLLSPKVYLKVC